jgi:outer membrane protein assembly factor BamB
MRMPVAVVILTICALTPLSAAELADAPWLMFHHDLNHTGLSTHNGPDTSAVKWVFPTGDKIYGSPVIGEDGTVYIGTRGRHSAITGSKLYAIYPNGTERWQWNPGHFIDSTPVVASDGTLYVGCWDKSLYAVHPNGTVKWEFTGPKGSFVYTSPAIAPDGTVYIGNDNNKLYAINPDGTEKWSYWTRGAIRSSPAIGADGTIYVGSYDKKLHAINPDGKLKWRYTTRWGIVSSPAIGQDGTIYVGSYDKKLHAINPADGTLKWKYTTGGRIRSSPAIGADGTIYVGSNDGKLHAVNPDGTRKWTYSTCCYVLSSPAIDADGTIYVGSFDRNLYAINPDGTLLWKYNTGDRIHYSSPAIGSDGTVYIGNWGGNVYAFGPGLQSNAPPVLEPIGDRMVNEAETLIIDVDATDPDGDTLTYSCNRTDLFTDFDPATGTGNWTTDYDDSGVYRIDFGVSDTAGGIVNETIRIEVLDVNRPPVLDPVSDRAVSEGSLLEFTITASDPDRDALVYIASNLPDGADFDSGTRKFSWTPGFDQAETYADVYFEVTDGELSDSENIAVTVENTDRAPVLDSIGDKSADENFLIEFTVNASDPDGDALIYSASNLPTGAEFNSGTRLFAWTPTFDQAGTYIDVHFEVNDSELSDWKNITITVENTNREPVLDPIRDKTAAENSLLEFMVTASDPDGDTLTHSASNLPAGAVFNATTQTFSWTPVFGQAGPHPDIRFEASDGELTDYENIMIVVNTTNGPPVLEQVGDKTVDENSLLEFTITASDPDGDSLTYSASNLPAGAEFNSGTGTFSWIPTFDQAETYIDVHFEVNDSELTDWEEITIVVNNTNRGPVLDLIGDNTTNEDSLIKFTVTATDPDGDAMSYNTSNLPAGAVFDQHTQVFSWTPGFNQAGTYLDAHFEVNDSELTDSENITITVENTDRPPILEQVGGRLADEGTPLEFMVTASDPDGDALTYSVSNLPAGAVFNSTMQTFSWTPGFNQAGTYQDICFDATDGELTDWENITITVENTDRPPVLDQIGARSVAEESLLEFMITATDPDGDALFYNASNLPAGAVFNSSTQVFSWTPTFGQAGMYPDVHFEVSDGELTDWEKITIVVADVAAPMVCVIVPDSEVMFQQQFTVNITVDPMMNEIYGVQYTLTFNNSVLHVEWQNEGDLLNYDGADTNVYINTIDNGAGTISFAATRVETEEGVTTPGTLAAIKFTAIRKGECSDLTLIDVAAADENGEEIDPIDITNSSICV